MGIPTFLNHPGSALATEIAARDWTTTSLGSIDGWPVSLKTTLATMLGCPTPMFLAWGPDLLSFYNDAYTPILGYRADGALGKPFPELWASLWDDIAPLVDEALAGGSTSVTDMRLDLGRAGEPEESYWSFSYSPAYDDEGRPNGMLCVTGETTDRVLAERAREQADERLQVALSAGNGIGAWDWDLVTDRVTADTRFAVLYGVDPERAAAGAPIADFLAGIHPDDVLRVRAEIEVAIASGGSFASEYRLLRQDGRERWVSAQGRCLSDEEGRPVRFPGVSFDITRRVAADLAIRAAKDERDFVIALTSRQRSLADAEIIIRQSAESLGRRLGVHRVGFYRLIAADRVRHGGNWTDGNLSPLLGEQAADAFGAFAHQTRSTGKTLVFGDSRHDQRGRLKPYAEAGVLAGLCVPLLDEEGRWQAGIYLHQAETRRWTEGEISLAKELAGLTWLAVERAEALVRLEQRVDLQDAELVKGAYQLTEQSAAREAAERQLHQLQKMEAVGQLTGGIAHDFNNMLAVVIGGLNLIERRRARGDTDIGRYLDAAMDGATRAAALTQRLLAFSRQQSLSPEAVDGNRLMSGLTELLTRTLGEHVQLETVLAAGLWQVRADPHQLENAIINLAVNARDAMPDGGRLTIELNNAHIDESYSGENDVSVGQYVLFAVTDTGTGMTPEVTARAFEPFFTTKEVGKGTGLGLSQVFGFVRQSGGHVKVYSEVGHGTTFKLYLPRFFGNATAIAPHRGPSSIRHGSPNEIVLVVEDEERVRNFSVEAIRELGYTVVHAANGREALDIIERGKDVSLLFTDIVMPGMTGRQLADKAMALLPDLKVLFTTGYARNAMVHNGVLRPGTNFLAKPFTIDQLAVKIGALFD